MSSGVWRPLLGASGQTALRSAVDPIPTPGHRLSLWHGRANRFGEITSGTALWYRGGEPPVPIRWPLVRDPKGELEPQAFLATDLDASPRDILAWFISRWQVEVTFEEVRAHLGVETQRSGPTRRSCVPPPSSSACSRSSLSGPMTSLKHESSSPEPLPGIQKPSSPSATPSPPCAAKFGAPADFFHVPAAPRQYRNSRPYLAPNGKRPRPRRLIRPKSRSGGMVFHEHPAIAIDVAVFPLTIGKAVFEFAHFPIAIFCRRIPQKLRREPQDDRAIRHLNRRRSLSRGLLIQRMGETANLPIIRVGTIAAMSGEKIETKYGHHEAFLAELRSIDGLSGLPVCVDLPLSRVLPHGYRIPMAITRSAARSTRSRLSRSRAAKPLPIESWCLRQ
jgi:hypothetical protein